MTIPDEPAADAALWRLRARIEEAAGLSHAGEPKRALLILREVLEASQRQGCHEEEMRALNIAAQCHYHRGDYLAGLASGFDAWQISRRLDDLVGGGHALLGVAGAAHALKSHAEAEQGFRRAMAIAAQVFDTELGLRAMNALGVVLGDIGRHEEAEAMLRAVWTQLEQRGDSVQLARTIANLANVRKKHGLALRDDQPQLADREFETAAVLTQRALHMLHGFDSKYDLADKTGLLGEIRLLQGEYSQAEPLLQQSLEWAQGLGNHGLQAQARLSLTRVHLQLGRRAAALDAARGAVNESRLAHHDEMELEAQELLAEAQALAGQPHDAAVTRHLAEFARTRLAEEHAASRREMHHIWRALPDMGGGALA